MLRSFKLCKNYNLQTNDNGFAFNTVLMGCKSNMATLSYRKYRKYINIIQVKVHVRTLCIYTVYTPDSRLYDLCMPSCHKLYST